jgi:hypothetical protein
VKKLLITVITIFIYCVIHAQQVPAQTEQQLENLTEALEEDIEDDNYLQYLQFFLKHPLNINTANEEDLRLFKFLTDLHIQNFLNYRRLLGNFISIYELQAIPVWDVETIKQLLPFVTASQAIEINEFFRKRFTAGEQFLLIRGTRTLEDKRGFDKTLRSHFLGSKDQLLFRYRYQYKNLLQYGVVGDKDAGEQFFRGAQAKGFDHYSYHLFARNIGNIRAIALGDYTANLGQGLIQWGALAFKKSADAVSIKRQASVLHPYNSAGEFYFNRGVGITIIKGNIEGTFFGSSRNISGNLALDTLNQQEKFTSFQTSGFHRTATEIEDRKQVRLSSFGSNINFQKNALKIGVNTIHHQFSKPLSKRADAYNHFAINGKGWRNHSFDYSYTYKNIHVFGEAAMDQENNKAIVQGAIMSVDPKVDLSFLYRNISKSYQALFGNAFTESTTPSNEKGFYSGITIRPGAGLRIDAYSDFYKFPWIRYRLHGPGYGRDYLLQLTYKPSKQVEIYGRYRNERKDINASENDSAIHYLVANLRQNIRVHMVYKLTSSFTLKARTEIVHFNKKSEGGEQGFLMYAEGGYKYGFRLSANLRLQYFETDSYNSRIYAYESDVLLSYSIPPFYDKGFRYYFNINYDVSRKLSFWMRWSQTIFNNRESIGSGLDQIAGNKRSDVKLQLRYVFK